MALPFFFTHLRAFCKIKYRFKRRNHILSAASRESLGHPPYAGGSGARAAQTEDV